MSNALCLKHNVQEHDALIVLTVSISTTTITSPFKKRASLK